MELKNEIYFIVSLFALSATYAGKQVFTLTDLYSHLWSHYYRWGNSQIRSKNHDPSQIESKNVSTRRESCQKFMKFVRKGHQSESEAPDLVSQ